MKIKFTATAVNETDKATIQALRKEYNLTEKEMMSVIINIANGQVQLLGELSRQTIEARTPRTRKTKVKAEVEVTPEVEVEEPIAELQEV